MSDSLFRRAQVRLVDSLPDTAVANGLGFRSRRAVNQQVRCGQAATQSHAPAGRSRQSSRRAYHLPTIRDCPARYPHWYSRTEQQVPGTLLRRFPEHSGNQNAAKPG